MSLLKIPLELFEEIAEECEPEDLLSLRLVSRETAAKTKRTFIQVHFSTIKAHLSDEGLIRAIKIAGHREFGKAITTLSIHPQHTFKVDLEEKSRSFYFKFRDHTTHKVETDLLRVLFTLLDSRQKPKTLCLWEEPGCTYERNGEKVAELALWDFRQVEAVFKTLAESELTTKELRIGFDGCVLPDEPQAFLSTWPSTFPHLKIFKCNAFCFDNYEEEALEVANILTRLPELEELEFINTGASDDEDGIFIAHLLKLTFSKLERLALTDFNVSVPQLVTFFDRHGIKAFEGTDLWLRNWGNGDDDVTLEDQIQDFINEMAEHGVVECKLKGDDTDFD